MSPAATLKIPTLRALADGDPQELSRVVSTMRPADVAEEIDRLPAEPAARVLAALPFDLAVQVFDEPELTKRRRLFENLPVQQAVALLEAMSADQQADLFRELPEAERSRFLASLQPSTRKTLTELMAYPPGSAGGIMTTEFMSVPADWTVEQVLADIRKVAREKETVYAVYVVDAKDGRLVHVVSLRDLLVAEPGAAILDVGKRRAPLVVHTRDSRDDVATLISKYNLLSAPVVDDAGRLLGIVTVDDVIDAIVSEQTQQAQRLGGVEALDKPYTQIGFGTMIKKRAGWLCVLFLSEMLTATAMQHFEGELSKAIVLTLFIPLIMSSGGNSGSQATSLIVRALALRELKLGDWWKIALRELPTGITLGSILGVIGIVRIFLWQHLHFYDYGVHWQRVALTVGAALVGVITFGSLAGSMLPFLLRRLGFDPAVSSAPFVATLVDVTGLIIYFSVAYLILHGTLL
ncbi:MAG TPA: magnesium transporter [Thermoanaerobaculia bacterium]|jgi:magnesium transporter|nr:magnesium transporter [Thermoanaerobaculia bacterium]